METPMDDERRLSSDRALRHSIKTLAKQYDLLDRLDARRIGAHSVVDDESAGVEAAVQQIEREVASYLADKYRLKGDEIERQPEMLKAA